VVFEVFANSVLIWTKRWGMQLWFLLYISSTQKLVALYIAVYYYIDHTGIDDVQLRTFRPSSGQTFA